MVSPQFTRISVTILASSGKHPLPNPLPSRVGVLHAQCFREFYETSAGFKILLMQRLNLLQVRPKRVPNRRGKQGYPVFLSLSAPNHDVAATVVQILDA